VILMGNPTVQSAYHQTSGRYRDNLPHDGGFVEGFAADTDVLERP